MKDTMLKGKIFKSPVLEAFSKTAPPIALSFYTLNALLFLTVNFFEPVSITKAIIVFLSGVFFWTLFEYLMHRYLFHFVAHTEKAKKFNYMVHGVHHEFPHDKERLFMPPLPGTIILAILFSIFYLLLNYYVYSFMAGMITGYLGYVIIHYLIHTRKPPALLKKLWNHHSLHHYKYPEKAYGVSSILWDVVFGSMPPKRKDT